VPSTGGDPVAVTEPADNVSQRHIDALPDGRGLMLTAHTGTPAQSQIAVVGPDGGKPREILDGVMARYAATGHIVYATAAGTLLAVPFDLRSLAVTGPAVPLAEGVAVDVNSTAQFALSKLGTLLYGTGAAPVDELVWVSRAGVVEPVDSAWTGELGSPALSPDESRLAVAVQGTTSRDVWVRQLDRGVSTRLTLDGDRNDYPVWTPDGRSVTFTSDLASPSFDLWSKHADGSGDPVLELDRPWAVAEALWSADGEWLIHRTSTNVQGAGDILARRRGPDTLHVPMVASTFTELAPALSYDGRWLAYSSNETGRAEVFVVPFPNASDAKWRVSLAGGIEPAWSRDGELFYRSARGEMVAVEVKTEPVFSVGATKVLFQDADYQRSGVHRQYDVTADGQRFILIRPMADERESQLVLVQNFIQALQPSGPR
jgi:serine/threonine-protein kinase